MKRNSLNQIKNSFKYKLLTLIILLIAAGCAPSADTTPTQYQSDPQASANVIYGGDGRMDVYQTSDERLKALASSTVALMKVSDLKVSGNLTLIQGENYGTQMNLCSSEKFREQDTAAFCSGSLIGPDLVLTAGHCIQNASDCQSTALVFGFAVKSAGVLPQSVDNNEVYRCQEIIKTQQVSNGADFAIIRLNRVVSNHAVLHYRTEGEVGLNDSLVVIGHPVGLPTKITVGGSVRSLANTQFILASLDTYGGNSGSAVFNAATGAIEGVLVRGEQDFESRGGCSVSKTCADGACRGEDVTRISVVRTYIPTTPPVNPPVTPPPIPPTPPQPPTPVLNDLFTSKVVVAIPDNLKTGVSSSLQVNRLPQNRKVIVSVDIKHTFIGDLVVKVISADGKTVTLHQRTGGNAKNLVKSYDVSASLGAVAQTGEYKLVVQDLAARDVGSIQSWSIEFR